MKYLLEFYTRRNGECEARYVCDEDDVERLLDGPLGACFYRRKIPVLGTEAELEAALEHAGNELATPARVAAVEAVLRESDEPVEYSDLRDLAAEKLEQATGGATRSYGHGNQISHIMKRLGAKEHTRERNMPAYSLLDAEYEEGPGRSE